MGLRARTSSKRKKTRKTITRLRKKSQSQERRVKIGTPVRKTLSMFERDLILPEEGAVCVDGNLQAAKYMIIHLMKRIHKGMNALWKFNVATDREHKLKNREAGYRPDITGADFPVKEIDPRTGEPGLLTEVEYLTIGSEETTNLKTRLSSVNISS